MSKNSMEFSGYVKDLRGSRFGRVVVEEFFESRNGQAVWTCRCDCGNTITLTRNQLHARKYPNCGCVRLKLIRPNRVYEKKHGMTGTRLYRIWRQMRHRCVSQNKNHDNYKLYASRGITVCNEWQEFAPFYEWAMQNGYTDELTLDRIDVNGNYEPNNCRWITNKEQQWNKRDTVYLEYDGIKKPLAEWCEIFGVNRHSCYNRMHMRGITDPQEILFGKQV